MFNLAIKFMPSYSSRLFLLIFILLLSACGRIQFSDTAPKVENGQINLTDWSFESNGQIRLNGEWEVFRDELISPEQINLDTSIPERSHQYVPELWGEGAQAVTLRLEIELGNLDEALGFYQPTPVPTGASKYFWNGVEFYALGNVHTSTDEANYLAQPFVTDLPVRPGLNELLIQIVGVPYHKAGYPRAPIIGEKERLLDAQASLLSAEFFLFAGLLLFAALQFSLFISRASDLTGLYIALICIVTAIWMSVEGQNTMSQSIGWFGWHARIKIEYLSIYSLAPLGFLILTSLYPIKIWRWVKVLIFALPLLFSLSILLPSGYVVAISAYYVPLSAFSLGVNLFIMYCAVRRRLDEPLLVLASLLVFGFAALYDTRLFFIRSGLFSNLDSIPLVFLYPYAMLLFVFIQTYVLTLKWSRLSSDKEKLEQASKGWLEMISSLEGAPIGIIITDGMGAIQSCNEAFCRIFGYDKSDLAKKDISILAPKIKDLIRNDYAKNHKTGKASQLLHVTREFETNRRDGTSVNIELSLSRTRVNDKHLFVGIVQDITERKQQEATFQQIFENSPSAMAIKPFAATGPLSYKYLAVNSAASELLGLSINQIMELDETIFCVPEDLEKFLKIVVSQGAIYNVETSVKHFKSGGSRNILASVTPTVYEGTRAVIFTAIDITHRKETEANLLEAKKKIEASAFIAKNTLDNMDQGFLQSSADNKSITLNKRLLELFNIPKDGVPLILSAEQLKALVLKGGQLTEADLEHSAEALQHGNKASYTLTTSTGAIIDIRQMPIESGGFVRTYTDLTKSRYAEAFLGDVLANTLDGIITTDADGIVKSVNTAFEKLFGFMAKETLGKNIRMIIPDMVAKHHDQYLADYKRTGKSWAIGRNREVVGKHKDGSTFPLEIAISKFSIAGDTFFTCIVRDFTEQTRTEETLRQAARNANTATEAKAAFLASMSHEIRTPMNGVVGMVDLLLQTKLDNEQTHMLNIARDSGQSLLTIINDILDFSKIEAGKLDVEMVESSITEIIEVAAQSLIPNAIKKSIHIITYIDPDLPAYLLADPVRVRQILINLGGNAIKFSESGEVLIKAVLAEQQGETGRTTVRFSVTDQGIGISDEVQKTLFKEFSQADVSTTRKFGGTGLGLSIAKHLTELMEGVIGVGSILGEGSMFFCDIPFSHLAKSRPEVNEKELAGFRTLLVCPSSNYEFVCENYLRHWGAEVITTTDMKHSIELALKAITQNKAFDVVVVLAYNLDKEILVLREAFTAAGLISNPRLIIGEDPHKKDRPLSDMEDVTTVSINPLQRAGLLTAMAVATGRANPEVHLKQRIFEIEGGRAPTPEEALEQNKLILLAEDNFTNQEVIRRQLTLLGYTCEIASDGKEAYVMWCKKSYALLLTDCHMPEWDGFELTKAVRKYEESTAKRTPIIAITANALQGEAERCIEGGMDDYMSKPVEMNSLQKTLHKWIGAGGLLKKETPSNSDSPQSTTTASQGATSNIGPIDPQALEELFGEDAQTISEILQSYVETTEAIISEMKDSWDSQSVTSVRMAAHKLKSSSRAVGANDLADICKAIEIAGNENDLDTISKLTPKLEPLFQLIQVYVSGQAKG